jgi:diguanylate cyclase (GGDEF)-like protein
VSRPADLVARYGGEEFVITLPETDLAGAIVITETVYSAIVALAIPHQASKVSDCVTVSIGVISLIPTLDFSPEYLIHQTDQALYLAKQQGRNRYCIANDLG